MMTPTETEALKDFAKWVEENKDKFLENETRITSLTLNMSQMAWKHLEYTAKLQGKDLQEYLTELIQKSFEASARIIISKTADLKILEKPVKKSGIEEYVVRANLKL